LRKNNPGKSLEEEVVVIKRGRTGGFWIGKVEVHLLSRQGGMIIALDMHMGV
jgi:hypothetical protein